MSLTRTSHSCHSLGELPAATGKPARLGSWNQGYVLRSAKQQAIKSKSRASVPEAGIEYGAEPQMIVFLAKVAELGRYVVPQFAASTGGWRGCDAACQGDTSDASGRRTSNSSLARDMPAIIRYTFAAI